LSLALVTGGTGFVGANLVRELLNDGRPVRVLARPRGDRRALEGLDVEIVDGDLLEPSTLRSAVHGVTTVFHAAADYRLWARDPSVIYRANVDGTRELLRACADAGVRRVVYTSSVGALGIPRDGSLGTEDTPVTLDDMVGPYKRSKFLGEQVAFEFARAGLPVVVVNPSAPIGPWDVKPTPTGQMVLDALHGRLLFTIDTGLNVVHVRDVARGHILAEAKGRVGEKYILGHEQGNLSLAAIGTLIAEVSGCRRPRLKIPYVLAWCAAACSEGFARLTRGTPRVPLDAVRMGRKRMYFSSAKAIRELGLPQTDPRVAVREAVEWFFQHGYVSLGAMTRVPAA
jgi:dihydroflavonol-4-reductase